MTAPFVPGARAILTQLSSSTGDVVFAPDAAGEGHWVGAPSARLVDGVWWLAHRERAPLDQGRGRANILSRSEDGVHFEPVAEVTSAMFGAASLERPALVPRPGGGWRLYVSCSTPGSKHWWVESLDAPTVAGLPRGTRTVVLAGDGTEAWKDPVVRRDGGRWQLWGCRHPLDGGDDEADRMTSHHATSQDGLQWSFTGRVLAPTPESWDARGTRVTAAYRGALFYDGRATAAENWHERTGLARPTHPSRSRDPPLQVAPCGISTSFRPAVGCGCTGRRRGPTARTTCARPSWSAPLLPTYSAAGGLRQGPRRDGESSARAARSVARRGRRHRRRPLTRGRGHAPQIGADDVSPLSTSAFDLSDRLAAKAEPALVADDERHFAAIAESLEQSIADLSDRLAAVRKAPGGAGQAAMERDLEVHRLTARLRALRRFGLDLCLGHLVSADDPEPIYIGRLGLTDRTGRRLLLDWRSPAAEPFFGATHANPMGLASRRRYRWTGGRITDYWDEVFTPEGFAGHAAALDDQSAFIASLGENRSARMRDVLGTIAADQDAVIRAGSRSALVVDGGPGTGKTVVALHRTAYLLYSDPRLGHRRGGVLFVGPHQPYLAYVSDVLPSLGEEGVQTCTVRDLVAEGVTASVETDPHVARLKSSSELVGAIEKAVAFYEEPPTAGMEVETPWSDIWLSTQDWAEAFTAPEPGTPHNEAREQVLDELLTILAAKVEDDVPTEQVCHSLRGNRELLSALHRAWPMIEPTDLVGDLWTVPAYLRMCAPWLEPEEVKALRRKDAQAWTVSDLPFLDAARHRLGDPQAPLRQRREDAFQAVEREQLAAVIDDLIAADDDGEGLVTMLRHPDIRENLVDESTATRTQTDLLAGPFAHVVVDEAQELTDAEWQMLLLRCPSRSLTIVGDRAQARHGFTESWQERLERIGLDRVDLASLSINYRTPEEVMTEAEPVIRSVLPDANVPTSIRRTRVAVVHGSALDLSTILDTWLTTHAEGVACVIGDPTYAATARVRSLTPELAKGLEFDLVVLVDPESFGTGIEGAVDRYVAMTRATQQLVILR